MSQVAVASVEQVGLLAHGGGAPEAAMIGAPVLVVLAFVWLERRARRRDRGE